ERVDDVALAEVRTDVADLRQSAPREPRDPRPEAERVGVDASGWHAERACHRAVLRDATDEEAEPRPGEQQRNERNPRRSEEDDDDATVWEDDVSHQRDAARHPRWILDLDILRAKERSRRLDQDQAEPPGREQRLERPAVEEPDHAALERHADHRRCAERD